MLNKMTLRDQKARCSWRSPLLIQPHPESQLGKLGVKKEKAYPRLIRVGTTSLKPILGVGVGEGKRKSADQGCMTIWGSQCAQS